MSVFDRIKKFNHDIEMFSPRKHLFCYLDLAVSIPFCGCSFDDYIRYRFWEKSMYKKRSFITYARSKWIIRKYNTGPEVEILADKRKFNERFHEYIGRKWAVLDRCGGRDAQELLTTCPYVVVKPYNGGQGKGVFLTESKTLRIDELVSQYGQLMIEEQIQQHSDMERLNPNSVNTIRVLTFMKGNEPKIIAASLRTGGSSGCTDNLHAGGVCASIDISTGVVYTKGIDYNYREHIVHPVTKQQIIGFQVPNWDAVKSTVVSAAKIVPHVKYIGWDVAITAEGCVLIEGNHDPGHDVIQMMDQIGKWDLLK